MASSSVISHFLDLQPPILESLQATNRLWQDFKGLMGRRLQGTGVLKTTPFTEADVRSQHLRIGHCGIGRDRILYGSSPINFLPNAVLTATAVSKYRVRTGTSVESSRPL